MSINTFDLRTSAAVSLYNAYGIEITLSKYSESVAFISVYKNNAANIAAHVRNDTMNCKEEPLPAQADDDCVTYPICHTDNYTITLYLPAAQDDTVLTVTKSITLKSTRGWNINTTEDD